MIKKGMSEKEFIDWKLNWFKEKGCPFFACSQVYERKVCGKDYICGALYDYNKYLKYEWKQECDVQLETDLEEKLPANCCPSCTNSKCVVEGTAKSCCPYMNDFYEDEVHIPVDRSLEKYFLSMGSYAIPVLGEEAYLDLNNNFELFVETIKKEK